MLLKIIPIPTREENRKFFTFVAKAKIQEKQVRHLVDLCQKTVLDFQKIRAKCKLIGPYANPILKILNETTDSVQRKSELIVTSKKLKIIRLDIGDMNLPLMPCVLAGVKKYWKIVEKERASIPYASKLVEQLQVATANFLNQNYKLKEPVKSQNLVFGAPTSSLFQVKLLCMTQKLKYGTISIYPKSLNQMKLLFDAPLPFKPALARDKKGTITGFNMEGFKSLIADGSKVIEICDPLNPYGYRITASEWKEIGDILRKQENAEVRIVIDAAYELVGEGPFTVSPLQYVPIDQIVLIRAFGKTTSSPGLRTGDMLVPSQWLKRIKDITNSTTGSHNLPNLAGMLGLYDQDLNSIKNAIKKQNLPLSKRRNIIKDWAPKLKEKGLELNVAPNTFYAVLKINQSKIGITNVQFFKILLENLGISVIPLSCNYPPPYDNKNEVRIAFGAATIQDLNNAFTRLYNFDFNNQSFTDPK